MDYPKKAIEDMSCLLPKEVRLKLFEKLCELVGKPIPERVWLVTGIKKTDVYRYLPKKAKSSRGGFIPDAKNTALVMKGLLSDECGLRGLETVEKILDPVEERMSKSLKSYHEWKMGLKDRNIIYNPLSDQELSKLERFAV